MGRTIFRQPFDDKIAAPRVYPRFRTDIVSRLYEIPSPVLSSPNSRRSPFFSISASSGNSLPIKPKPLQPHLLKKTLQENISSTQMVQKGFDF
ncbi:hypothetical protein AVEN_249534-1 [Araneus ventricosus]|uniref:Uncharacterized protein n=1 Tax=Araneus ventricosus TaxID=182803 RepID=A0A4Y2NW90_ARAVE|nr:hypothetical protein AVEN_249534-1 [Araneus ventricosus]